MKGKQRPPNSRTLLTFLNNVLTPGLPIGGAAVINAVADPQVGATQYNMGALLPRKKDQEE